MKFFKGLFYLFVSLVALPAAYALVSSVALSWVWEWFVQRQYGPGPSLAVWFGLASILRIATIDFAKLRETPEVPEVADADRVFWSNTLKSVVVVIMVLPCTFLLKLIGLILGWLQ